MEGGCPGKPSYPGRANFSYVSLENALKRLHARQANPPSRGTLSNCPRHPSKRTTFLPCKRFVPGYRLAEVRRPLKEHYIPRQLLTLTACGDYAQFLEYKIITLDTEKRPLAERVIKKLNLPPKRFFCPPSCLLCLAAAQ